MSLEEIKASIDAFSDTTKTTLTSTTARIDQIEAVLKRPGFGGGSANDNSSISAERDAVAVFARSDDESKLRNIQASMSVGSSPDGGYFVLPALSTSMSKKLFDDTPMRRIARVETITAGDAWEEPIDKGEPEAIWVGEQSARPATDTPKLASFRVPVHEIYSLQPITQRLLDDSGFDLGSWIEGKITDKFARSEGESFVTGNGVSRPRGFLTHETDAAKDDTRPWTKLQHVSSGHATLLTADGLKNLVWSLRAPYRQGSSFLMNSNTANTIDKLKNENGDYIWRSSMQAGAPPSLLGYPVEFDETMPDVAAGSLSIAFGNWKLAYVIIDKVGVRFLRDPYSSKPNVQFYAYKRVGGSLANSQALKLMKTQVE